MPYLTLVKASPLNPSTGSRVDIYLAGASDRRVTGLNGQVWEPAMTVQPILSFQGFNGDFTAPIDPGEARFAFNMEVVKKTWPSADTYDWAGAPVTVYAEEPGTAWPWTTRFVGKVRGFGRKGQTITVNASVDVEPFTKDVLTAVYGGGGGAEGGADIKNRVKPLVLGWAMNVEPVLINSTNSVYQFSGYGAIEAVTTLYERGSAFSASVGDYANYTALVAASIAPGKWGTCLAEGMIRLGAPAYGVITGDVKGHKVGATTPRLTGAIINALATISGVSSGNIESSTITGLDTAVPYNINLVLTDQITFLDIARHLALPCNHQAGVSLTGKFFVSTPSFAVSETLTLNARGRALPQVVSSDQLDVSPPYYRTVMGANRAWRVHSQDEIAYAVPRTPRGDYSGSTTYREGDIVTSPDGSTWIYINATPGAGNAPPTWPTTSNSYWDNMTGPSEVAYTVYLTNESATVAADSAGNVSSFTPAAGSMILLEAGDPVATGVTYSVVSSTNLTISINSSNGSYTVSAMAADTGTATLRATFDGKTFDKIYSLSRVRPGETTAFGTGNRVRFSQFEKGISGWARIYNPNSLAAPTYTTGTTSAHAYATMSFSFTATSQVVSFGQETSSAFLTGVTAGEWLAVSIGVNFTGPVATVGSRATVWFRNAAGATISSTDLTNTGTSMGGIATMHRGIVQAPANATSASIEVYATSNAAGAASITLTRPSIQGIAGSSSGYPEFIPGPGHEFGADVTSASQITIEMATDKVIPATYLGAVSSTDLANVIWTPVVQRGATAIKVANGTTYSLTNQAGGTFSVDNTNGSSGKGNVTISAMSANTATAELNVTVDGVAQPKILLKLTKSLAAPPSGGGSSGVTVSWTTGEFLALNTTSFTAVVTPVKTIALASGQSLYGTAPLDYIVAGLGAISRTMTFKWQYSVAGANSWNDFGTGITGDWATSAFYDGETYEYTEPYPGTVAVTQTKSGLSAGDYDIRLVAQCNATGRDCSPAGVATVEAKV